MFDTADTQLVPPSLPGRLSNVALSELCGLLEALDQLDRLQALPDREPSGADGHVAFGRFQLTRKLGAGRFGMVFLAVDPTLGRSVVVKVPQPAVLTDPELRERFVREAKAAARLDHPGIVPVFDAGEIHGLAYLAAGFVDGPTLAEWFVALAELPEPAIAAKLLAALARALQHAHDRGVLHCDLKPANVLLDRSGEVGPGVPGVGFPRVTDFGLARLIEDDPALTKTFQVVGTPLYMAPEQARGDRRGLTARADIFALGAMLYELLTGKPPHVGGTCAEVLLRLQVDDAVRPRKTNPKVPRDLEAICLKCLEKDPERRYVTAAELAADLDRFLAGRPVTARRVGLVASAVRRIRRHPVVAGLVGLTLLSTIAVAGLAVYFTLAKWEDRRAVRHAHDRADAANFYATIERIRQRRTLKQPGWVADNLVDLNRLAHDPLAATELPALRSEAALALASFDLPYPVAMSVGFNAHSVAFSPDGRSLALGSWLADDAGMSEIRLVDPRTGEIQNRFAFAVDRDWERRYGTPNTDGCRAIALSTDGRWLVGGTRSGWLLRWDRTAPDRPPVRWRHAIAIDRPRDEHIGGVAFTPSGRGLVATGSAAVTLWDVAADWSSVDRYATQGMSDIVHAARPNDPRIAFVNRQPIRVLEDPLRLELGAPVAFHFAAATPQARMIVARQIDPKRLGLYDLAVEKPIGTLALPDDEQAEDGPITSLAVHPHGELLATAAEHHGHLKIWSLAAGRLLAARNLGEGSLRAAFSPDGTCLAVVEQNRTLVYAIPQPRVREWIAVQELPVRDADVSPDSRYLATIAHVSHVPTEVTLWTRNATADYVPSSWPVPPPMDNNRWTIAVDSRGRVAYCADRELRGRSSPTSPETLSRSVRDAKDLRIAADGTVWTCALGRTFRAPTVAIPDDAIDDPEAGTPMCVAIGPNTAILGTSMGELQRISVRGGRPRAYWPIFEVPATAVALDATESLALVGSAVGDLALVRLESGAIVRRIPNAHRDAINAATFGPQGHFATGSGDRTVCLWSPDGQLVLTLPQTRPVRRLFWSADGRTLTVLAEGERGLRRWNLDQLKTELAAIGIESGLP